MQNIEIKKILRREKKKIERGRWTHEKEEVKWVDWVGEVIEDNISSLVKFCKYYRVVDIFQNWVINVDIWPNFLL